MPTSSGVPTGVSLEYLAELLGSAEVRRLAYSLPEATRGDLSDGALIDYIVAWKILNASVEQARDESHRLSNAAIPNGNFELLIASMMRGESLIDGLRQLAAGARILRPDLIFTASLNGGRPHLTVGFAAPLTSAKAVYLEALSVVVHCTLRWGTGRPIAPVTVRGPAVIGDRVGSFLPLLGPPVLRHGEAVTLVYGAEAADAPLSAAHFARWHDAAFTEYAKLVDELRWRAEHRVVAPSGSVLSQVRASLLRQLQDQHSVAHELGMSVATLRRRLAEEGASFRSIVDDIRRDAAEVLLLGDKSAEAIAAELGMSDSRCFRRACKAWFGAAPSEVRRSFRTAPRSSGEETLAMTTPR